MKRRPKRSSTSDVSTGDVSMETSPSCGIDGHSPITQGKRNEMYHYTIRIGSTPTILYFDLYLYSAYAAHYVYFNFLSGHAFRRQHRVSVVINELLI